MKWVSRVTDAVGLGEFPKLRKLVVAIIGATVMLFGVALIVLPGPAVIVIPLGLAILATEFTWARRAIQRGQLCFAKARRSDLAGKARSFVGRSR
jgi:hypothetical protein